VSSSAETWERVSSGVAAVEAHTSRERIVRLIQSGVLRGRLIGGKYFVDRDSFRGWLEQQGDRN
jgi:hypothetical protein